jgi:hypothetical protein
MSHEALMQEKNRRLSPFFSSDKNIFCSLMSHEALMQEKNRRLSPTTKAKKSTDASLGNL